jgi:hypothetical protein
MTVSVRVRVGRDRWQEKMAKAGQKREAAGALQAVARQLWLHRRCGDAPSDGLIRPLGAADFVITIAFHGICVSNPNPDLGLIRPTANSRNTGTFESRR